MTQKTISIHDFADSVIVDINSFRDKWLERHNQHPEIYPLELPLDNSGLWMEFFVEFYSTGGL